MGKKNKGKGASGGGPGTKDDAEGSKAGGPVVKAGALGKQSAWVKSWNTRWCTIDGPENKRDFKIFMKEGGEMRHNMPVRYCKVLVVERKDAHFRIESMKDDMAFAVDLRADSEGEMDDWTSTLWWEGAIQPGSQAEAEFDLARTASVAQKSMEAERPAANRRDDDDDAQPQPPAELQKLKTAGVIMKASVTATHSEDEVRPLEIRYNKSGSQSDDAPPIKLELEPTDNSSDGDTSVQVDSEDSMQKQASLGSMKKEASLGSMKKEASIDEQPSTAAHSSTDEQPELSTQGSLQHMINQMAQETADTASPSPKKRGGWAKLKKRVSLVHATGFMQKINAASKVDAISEDGTSASTTSDDDAAAKAGAEAAEAASAEYELCPDKLLLPGWRELMDERHLKRTDASCWTELESNSVSGERLYVATLAKRLELLKAQLPADELEHIETMRAEFKGTEERLIHELECQHLLHLETPQAIDETAPSHFMRADITIEESVSTIFECLVQCELRSNWDPMTVGSSRIWTRHDRDGDLVHMRLTSPVPLYSWDREFLIQRFWHTFDDGSIVMVMASPITQEEEDDRGCPPHDPRFQRGHLLRAGLILRPMRSQVVGSKTLNSTKVTHIVHASMFGKLTMEAISKKLLKKYVSLSDFKSFFYEVYLPSRAKQNDDNADSSVESADNNSVPCPESKDEIPLPEPQGADAMLVKFGKDVDKSMEIADKAIAGFANRMWEKMREPKTPETSAKADEAANGENDKKPQVLEEVHNLTKYFTQVVEREGWTMLEQKDDVVISSKPFGEHLPPLIRGETIIAHHADKLAAFIAELDNKPEWDANFDKGKCIERMDLHPTGPAGSSELHRFRSTEIWHQTHRGKMGFSARDFVHIWHCQHLDDAGYMVVGRSIPHQSCPALHKIIRADMLMEGFMIVPHEKLPNTTTVTFVSQLDYKGVVPGILARKLVGAGRTYAILKALDHVLSEELLRTASEKLL